MSATLISPIPIAPRATLIVSAQSAAERVEKKIFAELATCLTNEARRDYWVLLNEHTARNLANVEGLLRANEAPQAGAGAGANGGA